MTSSETEIALPPSKAEVWGSQDICLGEMCSARVCRGSHIPEESGGGELSGEQSLD